MTLEQLTHILALAASLESEGQYNNAKLLRAAVDSFLTHAAYQQPLSNDRAALVAETARVMDWLDSLPVQPELLTVIEQSRMALEKGRLPTFDETPDPYICRICGHLALANAARCPICGADPGTYKRFRPVYWIEVLDPVEALEVLRSTPGRFAVLLNAALDQPEDRSASSGWSIRQAVQHLKDAQGVLDYRVNLILEQNNPVLEAKAVFEWAAKEPAQPVSARQIFDAYCTSRAQTVARLEQISLKDWWRRGRHEEFGELKLYQQVSYFASHELTHFPQLAALTSMNR